MAKTQKLLKPDQLEAFYHDNFVKSQVADFIALTRSLLNPSFKVIVDIGGGVGYFAKAIQNAMGLPVRVLDSDIRSIECCKQAGIDAVKDDALNPTIVGDESVICFNLILHHLVSVSEPETRRLQKQALSVWRSTAQIVFVNEYIYESYFMTNFSGWLIFKITSSTVLSKIGSFMAKFAPSLKANTFGVGVRFRSHAEWREIFSSLGFEIMDTVIGPQEYVSLPRRCLLIKNCRRDSLLLKPKPLPQ